MTNPPLLRLEVNALSLWRATNLAFQRKGSIDIRIEQQEDGSWLIVDSGYKTITGLRAKSPAILFALLAGALAEEEDGIRLEVSPPGIEDNPPIDVEASSAEKT